MPGLLPKPLRARVETIARPLIERGLAGELNDGDEVAPEAIGWYGHPELDRVLAFLAGPIGRAVGAELLPTYSFLRFYPAGAALSRHRDREACEVSATLPIAPVDAAAWPIHLGAESGPGVAVAARAGEAVIYAGPELWHWREALAAPWSLHLFLHYVRADGEHAHLKFDRRTALGTPPA